MSLVYRKFINENDVNCFVYNDKKPNDVRVLHSNKQHWMESSVQDMNEIDMKTPDEPDEQEDPSVWDEWLAGN